MIADIAVIARDRKTSPFTTKDTKEHKGNQEPIFKVRLARPGRHQTILAGQFQIGTRSGLACTLEWADCKAGKLLIPQRLRIVPGISQVFENGILSAYVSLPGPSK